VSGGLRIFMSLQQRLERLSSVLTGLVAPRLAQSSHSSLGSRPTLSECRYHEPENLSGKIENHSLTGERCASAASIVDIILVEKGEVRVRDRYTYLPLFYLT